MGTCCVMGQAIGTAAALAVARGVDPAGVPVATLQQCLLADDAYLPGVVQARSPLTLAARLSACTGTGARVEPGDLEPLRDGINRQVGDDPHCWVATPDASVTYEFGETAMVDEVALVLDSAMERSIALRGPGWQEPFPAELPRAFHVDVLEHGRWATAASVTDNYQRHVVLPLRRPVRAVRFVLDATHAAPASRVYALLLNPLYRPVSPTRPSGSGKLSARLGRGIM